LRHSPRALVRLTGPRPRHRSGHRAKAIKDHRYSYLYCELAPQAGHPPRKEPRVWCPASPLGQFARRGFASRAGPPLRSGPKRAPLARRGSRPARRRRSRGRLAAPSPSGARGPSASLLRCAPSLLAIRLARLPPRARFASLAAGSSCHSPGPPRRARAAWR